MNQATRLRWLFVLAVFSVAFVWKLLLPQYGKVQAYDSNFFAEMDRTAMASAHAAAREIVALLHPKSAVDVGSGGGSWSKALLEAGVAEVTAVDGPWVDKTNLKIPASKFVVRDLSQPLSLERRFEMVLCLETAEHLPSSRAASFVEDLTRLAPVVVFSAAIPGQGGTMHVNEQWPDYWVALFERNGFQALDLLRPRLWNNQNVAPMYRQNMVVYVQKQHLEQQPELRALAQTAPPQVLSLVHPAVLRNSIADAVEQTRWQNRVKRALGLQ